MTRDDQDPRSGAITSQESVELRQRAEERAREEEDPWGPTSTPLPIEEAQQVLHELRVHQIELEMQNEELRRVQSELEASHERYFELYDLAPVAYLSLTEQALILEANLTATELLGEDRSALVDGPFTRFVLPAFQDTFYRHRRELFETGEPRTCELEMRRADGASFFARLEATLAVGADGETVSRTVVSDITERRREEAARLALEQRLQDAEKADSLGRMAGAIAHHFNNLLGVTMGNLELVLGELPSDSVPDARLSDALAATRSAAEVSGMLLTYLGQASGEQSAQDISAIWRTSIPILRAAMPPGVQLEGDLPPSGPSVNVSAGQARQVLRNLVTNAWEAVESERGTVTVALRTVSRGDIPTTDIHPQGWSPAEKWYACLSVTDSGRGIAPEHLDRVFEPFFSSKEFGRGLGLAVALGAVKANGGAIAVRSAPGTGTTMTAYFPVSIDEAHDSPQGAVPRANGVMEGTVLLIEDESMLRSVGTRMLTRLGFDVVTAEDGVAGLEAFGQHEDSIVCVVCDLTMPRMNGWDTLMALRARRSGVPIVLTSGFDEAHAMSAGHLERPQAFLSKPWSVARLRDAIGKARE